MKILDTRAAREPADTDMTPAEATAVRFEPFRCARAAGIATLALALAACNVSPTPAGSAAAPDASGDVRILDDFDDPSAWTVVTSNQVTGSLRAVDVDGASALCLAYDYHGVSG